MDIERMKTASGSSAESALMGLWLIVSPLMLGFVGVARAALVDVIAGVLVAVMGLYRSRHPRDSIGLSWTNAAIGIVLLASPWLLGFQHLGLAVGNNVIMGFAVAWFAAQSALTSETRPAVRI